MLKHRTFKLTQVCVFACVCPHIHLPPLVLKTLRGEPVWLCAVYAAFIQENTLYSASSVLFFIPAATLHLPLPVCVRVSLSVHLLGFTEGCSRILQDLSKQIAAAHLVVISTPLSFFFSFATFFCFKILRHVSSLHMARVTCYRQP